MGGTPGRMKITAEVFQVRQINVFNMNLSFQSLHFILSQKLILKCVWKAIYLKEKIDEVKN